MAMGAAPGVVRRMIVGQGLRLALIGIAGGLLFSLAMTHFVASLLFRVSAFDRETFLAGALILSIIVLISTWIPARRASHVDPIVALRYE
jgi:ABC-type antimicrobial peptide transport system permease subunit